MYITLPLRHSLQKHLKCDKLFIFITKLTTLGEILKELKVLNIYLIFSDNKSNLFLTIIIKVSKCFQYVLVISWWVDSWMSFCQNSVPSLCGGTWFTDPSDNPLFKYIIQFLNPLFRTCIPLFSFLVKIFLKFRKIHLLVKFDEILISFVFENISRFFLSHLLNSKETIQFSIIQYKFSLYAIHGLDVIAETQRTWYRWPYFQSALVFMKF